MDHTATPLFFKQNLLLYPLQSCPAFELAFFMDTTWIFCLIQFPTSTIKCPHDNAGFWTMVAALATGFSFYIIWRQLRSAANTSKGEFLQKFKEDFYNRDTRDLLWFIAKNFIEFKATGNNRCYFNIRFNKFPADVKAYLKLSGFTPPTVYREDDIDDLVLNNIEDLGLYERQGLIDIKLVYESFADVIEICCENPAIKEYLDNLKADDSDTYENLYYIYRKCASYGEAKRLKQSLFAWKIKWWIREGLAI